MMKSEPCWDKSWIPELLIGKREIVLASDTLGFNTLS